MHIPIVKCISFSAICKMNCNSKPPCIRQEIAESVLFYSCWVNCICIQCSNRQHNNNYTLIQMFSDKFTNLIHTYTNSNSSALTFAQRHTQQEIIMYSFAQIRIHQKTIYTETHTHTHTETETDLFKENKRERHQFTRNERSRSSDACLYWKYTHFYVYTQRFNKRVESKKKLKIQNGGYKRHGNFFPSFSNLYTFDVMGNCFNADNFPNLHWFTWNYSIISIKKLNKFTFHPNRITILNWFCEILFNARIIYTKKY